jgi:hypothetical protein
MNKRDVLVSYHVSVWLFHLTTDAARKWVDENVEEGAQWFGGALVVELHHAKNIVADMRGARLVVKGLNYDAAPVASLSSAITV